MSDPGQELIKAMASEVAKGTVAPFARMWSNAINGLIGDRIEEWRDDRIAYRSENASEVGRRAGKILADKNLKVDSTTPPEHLEEILEAGSARSEEELKDLFAKLLAAAVDPNKRKGYRRQFILAVKEMEPIDAQLFPLLEAHTGLAPTRHEYLAGRFQVPLDDVLMSFSNLTRLGALDAMPGHADRSLYPCLSAFGRSLLRFIR